MTPDPEPQELLERALTALNRAVLQCMKGEATGYVQSQLSKTIAEARDALVELQHSQALLPVIPVDADTEARIASAISKFRPNGVSEAGNTIRDTLAHAMQTQSPTMMPSTALAYADHLIEQLAQRVAAVASSANGQHP